MAKNKNNNFKNSTSNSNKDSANTSSNKSSGSMKDTNTQMPDNRPARSGPGGA